MVVNDLDSAMSEEALLTYSLDDSGESLPMGWHIEEGDFTMETAYAELSTRGMDVMTRTQFMKAKRAELEEFFGNMVWNVHRGADLASERVLKARWLLKWSKNADGSDRAKARLVLQGYNDPDALAGKISTTSPVTSRLGRNLCLTLSAQEGWRVWCADVKTAFLQSAPQTRKLYVRLPKDAAEMIGLAPDELMILEKPMYGQMDAPRQWFNRAKGDLLKIGLRQHRLDPMCLPLLQQRRQSRRLFALVRR